MCACVPGKPRSSPRHHQHTTPKLIRDLCDISAPLALYHNAHWHVKRYFASAPPTHATPIGYIMAHVSSVLAEKQGICLLFLVREMRDLSRASCPHNREPGRGSAGTCGMGAWRCARPQEQYWAGAGHLRGGYRQPARPPRAYRQRRHRGVGVAPAFAVAATDSHRARRWTALSPQYIPCRACRHLLAKRDKCARRSQAEREGGVGDPALG